MKIKHAIAAGTLVVTMAASGVAQAGAVGAKKDGANWSGGNAGRGWYVPDLAKLDPLAAARNWSGDKVGNGWYIPALLAAADGASRADGAR